MKRKSIVCLFLAALLLLACLSGCKKAPAAQGSASQTSGGSESTGVPLSSGDQPTAGTPRYVYLPEFYDIPKEIESIFNADCAAGKVFFIGRINMGEKHYTRKFTDENGVVRDQEVVEPNYRETIFTLDLESRQVSELPNIKAPEVPEGWERVDSRFNELLAQPDGTIWLMQYAQPVRYQLPADFDPELDNKESYYEAGADNVYLLHLKDDGTELARIDVGGRNCFHIQCDAKGRVYADVQNGIEVYDGSGTLLFSLENKDNGSLCRISEDEVALNCLAFDPLEKVNIAELRIIDADRQAFGETIRLGEYCGDILPGSGEFRFYYLRNGDVYGYQEDSQERPCLVNWVNCDLEPDRISQVRMLPDGRAFALYSNYQTNPATFYFVILNQVDASTQPEKTVLRMAGFQISSNISDAVVEFNRSNPNCRITVTDYANVSATPEAGIQVLNTEIMAGNVPDLYLSRNLPIAQLAGRGLLVDLYPLIDSDTHGIRRESLVQSVLKAMEDEGKLYEIPVSFEVRTAYGLTRVVGNYPTWDFNAVKEAKASLPDENATIFERDATKSSVLKDCLSTSLASFVDFTDSTCSFDSDSFISLLNFANSFPETADNQQNDSEPYESSTQRIARGGQLLTSVRFTSASTYIYSCLWFDEPISFVGYPCGTASNGSCFTAEFDSPFAISASCPDVDSAWEFISRFLTEEYQMREEFRMNCLPIVQTCLDASLEVLKQYRYSTGNDGKPFLDENGNKVMIPQETCTTGKTYPPDYRVTDKNGNLIAKPDANNPGMMEVYRLTDEQVDSIRKLINTTTQFAAGQNSLTDIIIEECNPFFAGEKDVNTTAEMIQRRASLLIAEIG